MPTKKRNFIFSILASASMLLALSTGLWDYSSAAAMSAAACSAAITVSNANDDRAGSLRQALVDVCAGGTISFDASVFNSTSPQTITLLTPFVLYKNLMLDGPGTDVLAISGGDKLVPFFIGQGTTVVIQDVTITAGYSLTGSGITNYGTLTIQNITLSGNSAFMDGGGISNYGTLTIQNSTLSGNTAGWSGGGIYNYASLTVRNSTLSENTALVGTGGGIHNEGTLTIQNSTLSGNTAILGGGISNAGTLTIQNSTLSGNPRGIFNYTSSTLNYTNTIIANSTIGDCDNSGSIGTNNNNLVEDGTCAAAKSGDPRLGTLGNYGGSTQTMKPGTGSPAIDAGSSCLATDQRGVTRGTPCDIGAFETSGVMVKTETATSVSGTGVMLNGTINTNDSDSLTITFEYGTSSSYGTTVAATPSTASGMGDVAVSNAPTGLTPNSTYHYRVLGTGASTGTSTGEDVTFTTNKVAPVATTNAATDVTGTGATLNGTVNARNDDTSVTFQYGLTDSYGTTLTATPGTVTGASDTAVSTALTGLALNSTYHYRVLATNSAGTTNGLDATFTTSAVVPTVTTDAASSIASTGATLNGTLNANNASTTVTFEYGTSTAYGTTPSASPSLVTGTSNTSVSKALTGLTPNTTYHYRAVAVNSAGTTNGSDATFTTSAVVPTVTTDAASSITGSGATLNGTVNAKNASTTVTFQYGLTTGYGTSVAATPGTVTGMSDTAVSLTLTGLALNTTYHYRLVATNSAGTTNGLDKTFTTGKVAPTATTDAATDVTSTGATLNGTVNAGNDDTSVTFEYGLTDSYGTTLTATPGTVTGTNDTAVSTALTELAMNSTYHYRVVAVNSAGTSNGEDETFTTTSVSITGEIHDAKHKLILSAAIGDSLHASATVTGNAAGTPTGTLRFTTFDNTSCSGSGLSAGTVKLDGSGQAHPSTIQTLSVNGRAFKVRYNGDAIYSAAEGECTAISNSPYPTVLVLASSTVPADGTELKVGPTQLLVQFNQNMWHSSTADPHAVQNPQNYLLVEAGQNQVFDTLACGPVGVGGVKPDDHVVKVDSVTYDAVTFKATLKINDGQKLPNGSYRLFICGTTSISDASDQVFLNNHLKDSLISFSVVPAASFSGKKLPKTGFAPGVVSSLPERPADVLYSESGMWLEIRKLGVLLPVVGVPHKTGWDVTWLGNQAGYLEGTAFPTWNGNSVITGHVTGADGQPGAFAGLSGLAWGDEVVIHAWGQRYIFAVRSVDDTVNPEDTRLLDQHEILPWITLLTCRGYDEQSDSYRWRTAVRAVLVRVLNEDGP